MPDLRLGRNNISRAHFGAKKVQTIWHVFVFQVAARFVGSFRCDQQCGHLQDDLKTECELEFCEELDTDDDYGYDYDK